MQAQTQLDQMAATLSSSLSDMTTAGTAVTSGIQSGFNVDMSNVQPGNSINLTYTDNTTTPRIRLRSCAWTIRPRCRCPMRQRQSAGDRRQFLGRDGFDRCAAQRGGRQNNLQFSNPSGTTLQVLDQRGGDVNAASITVTTPSLANGNPQLPLFTDAARSIPA